MKSVRFSPTDSEGMSNNSVCTHVVMLISLDRYLKHRIKHKNKFLLHYLSRDRFLSSFLGPWEMGYAFHNEMKSVLKKKYTNSLVNATFGSWKKSC